MWLSCAFILAFAAQEPVRPLPDAESFRSAVPGIVLSANDSLRWAVFHNDFIPKANDYNYTELETSVTQDDPATSETKIYTITRSPGIWQSYRRQTFRNGSPLTDQEIQQQDREHERFENAVLANVAKAESRTDSSKKAAAEESSRLLEGFKNDVIAMFEIRVIGTERINDLPVVSLEMKPRRGYRPKTEVAELWQDVTIRAWVTEKDREVVRLTAAIDEKFDEGLIVLEKGATLSVERRLINGEIWLPTRIEIDNRRTRTNGRLGPRQRVISEFADFKKFTVDAVVRPIPLQ
jgi:hypothetical protein